MLEVPGYAEKIEEKRETIKEASNYLENKYVDYIVTTGKGYCYGRIIIGAFIFKN